MRAQVGISHQGVSNFDVSSSINQWGFAAAAEDILIFFHYSSPMTGFPSITRHPPKEAKNEKKGAADSGFAVELGTLLSAQQKNGKRRSLFRSKTWQSCLFIYCQWYVPIFPSSLMLLSRIIRWLLDLCICKFLLFSGSHQSSCEDVLQKVLVHQCQPRNFACDFTLCRMPVFLV